jgi:DNA-binding response OmpR family regulator
LEATISVHPFHFDPDVTVTVPLVRWPDEAVTRERLARTSTPCLLVVAGPARPPTQWSELEDWVREQAPRAEFVTRATTVARRADRLGRPYLDRGRAVRFRERTVIVPESQLQLVALLVERYGETVSDVEIRAICGEGGTSTHGEAMKTALRRLRNTLAPLGLHLARVRASGYLLDRAD